MVKGGSERREAELPGGEELGAGLGSSGKEGGPAGVRGGWRVRSRQDGGMGGRGGGGGAGGQDLPSVEGMELLNYSEAMEASVALRVC